MRAPSFPLSPIGVLLALCLREACPSCLLSQLGGLPCPGQVGFSSFMDSQAWVHPGVFEKHLAGDMGIRGVSSFSL